MTKKGDIWKEVDDYEKHRKKLKEVERVVTGSTPWVILGPECKYWIGKKVQVRLVE